MLNFLKRIATTIRRIPDRIYVSSMQIAHTKIALYIMLTVALINAYAVLLENDIFAMLVFIISGLAVSLKTKNMTIVLFAAIIGVNLLRAIRVYVYKIEGFEDDEVVNETTGDKNAVMPLDVSADATKNKDESKDIPINPDVASKIENFEDTYAQLMKLQNEIVEGVKRVHEPLAKVETIVNGLKESMATMNG